MSNRRYLTIALALTAINGCIALGACNSQPAAQAATVAQPAAKAHGKAHKRHTARKAAKAKVARYTLLADRPDGLEYAIDTNLTRADCFAYAAHLAQLQSDTDFHCAPQH